MINTARIKTYPLKGRKSKVKKSDFAQKPQGKKSFASFFKGLPKILKARDLAVVVEAVVRAQRMSKAVLFMAGAHVIKCGLSPVIIELMQKKVITCLALNGAGIIHDFEIAFQGRTSEDVAESLRNGSFGMGRETADFLNQAIKAGAGQGFGIGASVSCKIAKSRLPYKNLSLLYSAYKEKIPVCVHVAIGTDVIHQHPSFDAAACGEATLRDFHLLTENVAGLNRGGVVLHFGSAVILPEVFLKALNLARNLGHPVKDFITANFDMLYHYRPLENVVRRPVMTGGKGYYIIGHHEIMLPLFAQAVLERL